MEDAKVKLINAAVELLSQHDVKQKQIFKWIREAFIDHVRDMPKVRVVYNNCHGGFGLSTKFKEYIGSEYVDSRSRTKYVDKIQHFGRTIMQRYEQHRLLDVLYCYHTQNFGQVFGVLTNIVRNQQYIDNIVRNAEILRAYLADPNISHPLATIAPSEFELKYGINDFRRYTVQGWQDLLAKYDSGSITNYYKNEIETHDLNLKHLDESVLEDMKKFIVRIQSRNIERMCFIDMLNKYGVDDLCTWSVQRYYNENAIMYLLSNPPHIESYDEKILRYVEEQFGLLCASDTYAKLAITEVPALIDWRISEYDGLERVVLE